MIETVTITTPDLQWNLQYAALFWCGLAQFYFVSLYSGVNWKGHFVGRALFGQSAALLFVYVVILFSRAFEFPGEDWLRVGSYFILAIALTNQAYALWKQQHTAKYVLSGKDEAHD